MVGTETEVSEELKHTVGTATEISERAGIGWHGRAGPGRHEEKRVVRESATVVPLSTSKRSLVLVTKSGKLGAESVEITPSPVSASKTRSEASHLVYSRAVVLGLVRGTRVGCMRCWVWSKAHGWYACKPSSPFGGCGTFGTFDYIGVSLTGVTLWTRVTALATGLGTG